MKAPIGLAVFLALLVTTTTGYSTYQTYTPNGPNVPSPCQPGTVWSGVGHRIPAGGGDRNPFGLALANNQYNWTKICPMDSDGDGKTNGQELGDPNCTWKVGMTSPSGAGLSHPGICEPLNLMTCMSLNSWLTCPNQFTCPAINQPGVLSSALRLPPTAVPAQETSFIRYGVYLPNDTDYHIIAYTPIINTSQVLHHMLLLGCDDGFSDYGIRETALPSGLMPVQHCTSLIGLWALGANGVCLTSEYGFLIGKNGFKYALLEYHWNNPTLSTSYFDSSGMTIYYTPKLRPNTGGVVLTGQDELYINPGLVSTSFLGGCSGYCTSALPRSVYIASTFLHMHNLGKAGTVQLFRNGVLKATLLNTPKYDYNSPESVSLDTPVELRPGDSIVVNCTYQSIGQTSVVTFGEGDSKEMCYAFLTYYPVNPQFITCSKRRTVEVCSNVPDRCSTNGFYTLAAVVSDVCRTSGSCSSTCKDLMQTIVNTGCVTDDYLRVIPYYTNQTTQSLANLISVCGVSNSPIISTTSSSRPNSATRLSMEMTLILNTALSTLSFVLTLLLTRGYIKVVLI